MAREKPGDEKRDALRAHHALNPRPQTVTDTAFVSGNPFFDPRDLVQVKYEMLRRVLTDSQPVSRAAAAFGFSRPSFYQAQADFQSRGLPGLLPERRGPRRAHKLSPEVLVFIEGVLADNPALHSRQLAQRVQERFGVSVHPRSIERALARHQKKRPQRED